MAENPMFLNGGNLLNGGKGQASKWWIELTVKRGDLFSPGSRLDTRHQVETETNSV